MPKAKAEPAHDPKRERNIEVYAPELLLLALERPPGWDKDRRWRWAEQDFGWFGWTFGGGKSANHDEMIAAALCARGTDWKEEGRPRYVSEVLKLWASVMAWQLGTEEPPERRGVGRFLAGEESNSNTYIGMIVGSADGLLLSLLAFQPLRAQAPADLVELCKLYVRTHCALMALGAVPEPTRSATVLSIGETGAVETAEVWTHLNRHGDPWWSGPSLASPGGRSTVAHLGEDQRLPAFCRVCAGRSVEPGRFGWPGDISNLVGKRAPMGDLLVWRDYGAALGLLQKVRLAVPVHFLRWRRGGGEGDAVLVYAEWNPSTNTGTNLFESRVGDRVTVGYPYRGRIRKRKGGEGVDRGLCWIDGNRVVAQTKHGEVSAPLPVIGRRADSHIVVGPEGLKRIA